MSLYESAKSHVAPGALNRLQPGKRALERDSPVYRKMGGPPLNSSFPQECSRDG